MQVYPYEKDTPANDHQDRSGNEGEANFTSRFGCHPAGKDDRTEDEETAETQEAG